MAEEYPRLTTNIENPEADALLRALVAACEAAFPGRIRSYMLSGSYASGDPIPESDLDLGILFRGTATDGERQRLRALLRAIEGHGVVRLDAVALSEDQYLQNAYAGALEAIPIYGEDVRGEVTLEELARAWPRHLSAATYYTWQLRGLRAGLVWPVDYPEPDGEFYGYERYGYFNGDDPDKMYTPGCRTIVNCATMIATARLTRAGQRIPSKRASVERYRAFAPGEVSDWLAALYDACKMRWSYHIPNDPAERAALRDLFTPMLAFENDFLAFARPLTEEALRTAHDEADWTYARDRLRWIAYPDLGAPQDSHDSPS
jgi:nucleotidyltransferase-like protein